MKLRVAEAAALADDIRFAPNVSALQAVLPDDLLPEEIDARPGATWIESTDVSAFVREALGATQVAVEHIEVTATWTIAVPTWQKQSLAMTSTWGTDRLDAVNLLTKSLNQTSAVVYDSDGDGGTGVQPRGHPAWPGRSNRSSPTASPHGSGRTNSRSERLATRYNELFNSVVLPVLGRQSPVPARTLVRVSTAPPPARRHLAIGAGAGSAARPCGRCRQDSHHGRWPAWR